MTPSIFPRRCANATCAPTEQMPKCQSGTWGADFFAVRPRPASRSSIKHRYSAMINTGLDALLKQRGIKSLLLTGVATDTCVEATARDAYFIDYYVTLVQDCCGALDEDDHRTALKRFARDYGPVVTSSEVIAAWQRTPSQTRAAAAELLPGS